MLNFHKHVPLILLAGILVLCFGQFSTVVHIHHSHDDGLLPFEISFHPIDFDPDHVPGHHGGEDHHHSFDQDFSKWLLARSQQTGPKLQQTPLCIIGAQAISTPKLLGPLSVASVSLTLVDQSTRFKCDPRSPPLTA